MKPVDMDVLILCGGKGTRLSSVVSDRPKPMAQIADRPFLDILIEYISGFGFKRFILCTGYKSELIHQYYNIKQIPEDILISEEKSPLGTAGAVKNAETKIESETFIVVNGDSFCPVDMQCFIDYHENKNATISVVLAEDKKRNDGGTVVIDDMHRICIFLEKSGECETSLINAGIYCFQKELLGLIPEKQKCSLEYDIFPQLTKDRFLGFVNDKPMLDIGTPERYQLAKKIMFKNYKQFDKKYAEVDNVR